MRIVIVVLIVGFILAQLCLYTVDRTEFVYVTQFGRHIATLDGASDDEAGLHVKWPWPVQAVLRLDRRLQAFELPGAELLTRDPKGNTIDKTLTLDAYVCWRIADNPGSVDVFFARSARLTAPGPCWGNGSAASWERPSARWSSTT